jgi:hypothetical protein
VSDVPWCVWRVVCSRVTVRSVDAIVEMFGREWLLQRRRALVEMLDLCEHVNALHIGNVDTSLCDADTIRAGDDVRVCVYVRMTLMQRYWPYGICRR